MDYEIYEGRTEGQNRKKKYLVFPYGGDYLTFLQVEKISGRFFRVSKEHIKVCYGYTIKNELYLENPKNKPAGAKTVRVAYYV